MENTATLELGPKMHGRLLPYRMYKVLVDSGMSPDLTKYDMQSYQNLSSREIDEITEVMQKEYANIRKLFSYKGRALPKNFDEFTKLDLGSCHKKFEESKEALKEALLNNKTSKLYKRLHDTKDDRERELSNDTIHILLSGAYEDRDTLRNANVDNLRNLLEVQGTDMKAFKLLVHNIELNGQRQMQGRLMTLNRIINRADLSNFSQIINEMQGFVGGTEMLAARINSMDKSPDIDLFSKYITETSPKLFTKFILGIEMKKGLCFMEQVSQGTAWLTKDTIDDTTIYGVDSLIGIINTIEYPNNLISFLNRVDQKKMEALLTQDKSREKNLPGIPTLFTYLDEIAGQDTPLKSLIHYINTSNPQTVLQEIKSDMQGLTYALSSNPFREE